MFHWVVLFYVLVDLLVVHLFHHVPESPTVRGSADPPLFTANITASALLALNPKVARKNGLHTCTGVLLGKVQVKALVRLGS